MGELIHRCKLWAFLFFWTTMSLFSRSSLAIDSIRAGESINGSTQMLVSAKQKFVLGIFTPQGSKFQYLGIWYKNIPQTIVWVANRDSPLVNSSGKLEIRRRNIVLFNETNGILWSSNSSSPMKQPVAQLLDTGNWVLKQSGSEIFAWQSFDYPSHTLLPGMKLGWDLKTGLNRKLTSWKSLDDPSNGNFTCGIDLGGLPQFVLRKGLVTLYRGGPWYGDRFSSNAPFTETDTHFPRFDYNATEAYYSYESGKNLIGRYELTADGFFTQFIWSDDEKDWYISFKLPGDGCDNYGKCGDNGVCTFSPIEQCNCMSGFEPKDPADWKKKKWSKGCVRRDNRTCRNGEGFKPISNLKLPDSSANLVNVSRSNSIEDCEAACKNDCFCLAYGLMQLSTGGYDCVTWIEKLMDARIVPQNGQDMYVRLAASELASELDSSKRKLVVVLSVSVALLTSFMVLVVSFILWRRRKLGGNEITTGENHSQENEVEMLLYDFTDIKTATNNFSLSNKIGEGGFGPVYKGKLPCGQEIAVKRLAEGSGQGQSEFKNEILLISKLQHRNLVKLLGFCSHREQTLLVYEYMPNKSLDYFLFDIKMRSLLNWKIRLDIIIGIARGLLYLHRDSRLLIIHRDLKVSNILLDNQMNPKISDFGMARMFADDQTMTKTKRVVGTYGYMSPEYAIDGFFSLKSDIFSFGVILLEIVSGKRNRGFFHPDHKLNLLGHAWKLWDEGNALELMDETLKDQFQNSEALRCIQVGLLCVQENPDERPTMWSVLTMLESENMLLSRPKRPGFYTDRMISKSQKPLTESSGSNEATVTLLQGR